MARYTLVIPGRLDNLNDYISACRTNQYKGSKIKASNEHKVLVAIYDALVQAKVLKNDGWKNIIRFSDDFYLDPDNPRIEVDIEEI